MLLRNAYLYGAGSRSPDDLVWYLPDPVGMDGETRHLMNPGGAVITATSDGAVWRNAAGVEVANYWLPRGALVHIERSKGNYYWNGAVKALGDLTANGDGSYILNLAATPLDFSAGEQTVVVDYTAAWPTVPTGHLWAMTATPVNTALRMQAGTSGFMAAVGSYYAPSGQTITLPLTSLDGESSGFPGYGRHRFVLRLKNGETIRFQPDNGQLRNTNPVRTGAAIPNITRIGIGCGVVGSTGAAQALATNMVLNAITVYNRVLTDAEMDAVGNTGDDPAFHILGDSFMTLYQSQHRVSKWIAENGSGGYVGASSDAVGGSTMTDQATRYLNSNSKWKRATVIVGDMGASLDMPAACAQIRSLNAVGRMLVLEPAPNTADVLGSAERIAWDARRDALQAEAGDSWVPTLAAAQALSDGSANDIAQVAKGLWPASLTLALDNFHPSSAGDDFLAETIREALIARDWLYGPSVPVTTWDAAAKGPNILLSNGDLSAAGTGSWNSVLSTTSHATGKRYFELLVETTPSGAGSKAETMWGLSENDALLTEYPTHTGDNTCSRGTGQLLTHGGNFAGMGVAMPVTSIVAGDVVQCLVDFDNKKMYFGVNNDWGGSDPVAGTSPHVTWTFSPTGFIIWGNDNSSACQMRLRTHVSQFTKTMPAGAGGWDDA